MNTIDIVLTIIFLIGGVMGFRKGLIHMIFMFLAMIILLIAGTWLASKAAEWLSVQLQTNSAWLPYAGYSLVVIAVFVAMFFVTRLSEAFIKLVALSLINRLAGAGIGILKWIVISSLVFHLVQPLNQKFNFFNKEYTSESKLLGPVQQVAPIVIPYFKTLQDKIQKTKDQFSSTILIPGSSLPSIYSSKAPPPVET